MTPRAHKTPAPEAIGMACDAILAEAGRAELARFDDLLGGAIASNPEEWRRLAMVRDTALRYAAAVARAGFLTGLGGGQP